ncbi:DUF418 domain-containing protein [Massilia cavernae]|uniref:DUF418 domain-containing protein n=1 Tax=Massilia cavernae TaxID=2320864 RepID=A0A418Y8K4_9BURK|nr:DUF418 domain-containing protein [Massilia cavernae]RJG27639.1 DUF418 domain-containing protein [Massilia cavernae]
MAAPSSRRSERIDALRGFAVFGILLINVWGFVYGYAVLRYGPMGGDDSQADRFAVFFAAAFAEQKFYPIFSFLFGAGFALQIRSLTKSVGALEAMRIYRRRLGWLLVVGLLHGSLLWFGDILTAYALTGFWVFRKGLQPLSKVRESFDAAVLLNGGLLLLMALLTVFIATSSDFAADALVEVLRAADIYVNGGWGEVARERLKDFGTNLSGFWLFIPRLMLLFLLGVFAVRLGWITRPHRHRRLWLCVLAAGLLVALPLNLWWGYSAVDMAVGAGTPRPTSHAALYLLELSGPALGAAYIAAFMLAGERAMDSVARWLAPVGRMALTNYLVQSLALGLMLPAYGLGLGALLGRIELLALCMAIMLVQVLLSRWWLSGHQQGPFEALWRRFTYRR